MRYLKHTPSGELYPFNEHLARRDDMEEVAGPDKPAAKPAPKAAKKAAKAPVPQPERALPDADLDDDDLMAGLDD